MWPEATGIQIYRFLCLQQLVSIEQHNYSEHILKKLPCLLCQGVSERPVKSELFW